jgi:hypothetical protein
MATWDESNPENTDSAGYGAEEIRNLKIEVRKRMNHLVTDWTFNPDTTTIELKNSLITTDKIINNAVNADKIATGAVIADKIASGVVDNSKLATGAVGSGKLATSASFSSAITRYKSYSAANFAYTDGTFTDDYTTVHGQNANTTDSCGGITNLDLPHGAIITEMRFYGKGPSGSDRQTKLYLRRASRSGSSWTDIAGLILSDTTPQEVSTSVSHTIDHQNYIYQLFFIIEAPTVTGSGKEGYIRGIRLTYTVSQPLP